MDPVIYLAWVRGSEYHNLNIYIGKIGQGWFFHALERFCKLTLI